MHEQSVEKYCFSPSNMQICDVLVTVVVVSNHDGNGNRTKTSLETKHLGNSDYLVIIASSSHALLLTEHAANGLVEAPLK